MFIVRAFGTKQIFKFITSNCGLFIYLFIYNSLTVFFRPFDCFVLLDDESEDVG